MDAVVLHHRINQERQFYPEGLAFKECKTGVFFRELLKKVIVR
jgi:hypothetical protein